jgi:hypothetical protein
MRVSRWLVASTLLALAGVARSQDDLPRSEAAKKLGVVALTHMTPIDLLPKIVETGALIPGSESGHGDRKTVFMTAQFGKDAPSESISDPTIFAEYRRSALLVFSTKPLDRDDYNGAPDWSGYGQGGVPAKKLLASVKKNLDAWNQNENELVFRSRVSLDDLKEILVAPIHRDAVIAALEKTGAAPPKGLTWADVVVPTFDVWGGLIGRVFRSVITWARAIPSGGTLDLWKHVRAVPNPPGSPSFEEEASRILGDTSLNTNERNERFVDAILQRLPDATRKAALRRLRPGLDEAVRTVILERLARPRDLERVGGPRTTSAGVTSALGELTERVHEATDPGARVRER